MKRTMEGWRQLTQDHLAEMQSANGACCPDAPSSEQPRLGRHWGQHRRQRRRLLAHWASCPACRANALLAAGLDEVEAESAAVVKARAPRREASGRGWWGAPARALGGAAAAVILGAGLWLGLGSGLGFGRSGRRATPERAMTARREAVAAGLACARCGRAGTSEAASLARARRARRAGTAALGTPRAEMARLAITPGVLPSISAPAEGWTESQQGFQAQPSPAAARALALGPGPEPTPGGDGAIASSTVSAAGAAEAASARTAESAAEMTPVAALAFASTARLASVPTARNTAGATGGMGQGSVWPRLAIPRAIAGESVLGTQRGARLAGRQGPASLPRSLPTLLPTLLPRLRPTLGLSFGPPPAAAFAEGVGGSGRSSRNNQAAEKNSTTPRLRGAASQWRVSPRGILESSFDGKTWRALAHPPARGLEAVAGMGAKVWAAGRGATIYLSSDDGAHWSRVAFANEATARRERIDALAFQDPLHGRLQTTTGKAWITSDGGWHWTPAPQPQP